MNVEGDRTYVRMQQWYDDIPVFAGEMTVQLEGQNGVAAAVSMLMTNSYDLDMGNVSTEPTFTAEEAEVIAMFELAIIASVKYDSGELSTYLSESDLRIAALTELSVYDPALTNEDGSPRLAWKVRVSDRSSALFSREAFIDAATGDLLFHHSLIFENHPAGQIDRNIYDGGLDDIGPDVLKRSEIQPPTGNAEFDTLYDYLGLTYDYYSDNHHINGMDANDLSIHAIALYREAPLNVPWKNAKFLPLYHYDPEGEDPTRETLVFGDGGSPVSWARSLDGVAHEYTHGVTFFHSSLHGFDEAGAINESLSDLWGEFLDREVSGGTDWIFGEAHTPPELPDHPNGGIRNMKNPPEFSIPQSKGGDSHPDRYTDFVVPTPDPDWDNGAVHANAGINNKLCFLLVDGENFNGQIVDPTDPDPATSMALVADLYFECQQNLLLNGSTYKFLYFALTQAAINLGWDETMRQNLENACQAVEIAIPGPAFRIRLSNSSVSVVEFRPDGNCLASHGIGQSGTGYKRLCPIQEVSRLWEQKSVRAGNFRLRTRLRRSSGIW